MAAIAAMSLGSLAALPKAMRGRRNGGEVNRIRGSASARPIVRPAAAARGAEIRTRAVANVGVAMMPGLGADGVWDPLGLGRQKGWEVGDNDWNSDERRLEGSGSVMAMTRGGRSVKAMNTGAGGSGDFMNDLMNSKLPGKIGTVLLLLILSRVGTYIPISGVDRDAFAESLQGGGNIFCRGIGLRAHAEPAGSTLISLWITPCNKRLLSQPFPMFVPSPSWQNDHVDIK